jgi:hypothetical protein
MHTHFCRKCGCTFKQSGCRVEKRLWFIWRVLCPRCSVPVEYSGGMLLIFALIAAIVFASTSLGMETDILGVVVCVPLCIIGVIRSFRQVRLARVYGAAQKNA